MIPMGERVRQAGDRAVPMLVDIHIHAAAEAFQALAALGETS
jgi:predicted amidohydrolase YtcJ